MVGVWGKELRREDIYNKELDFLISTSYGPGRYDENYEQRGVDYPYAYVRWTENRNMEEYLRLLASDKVNVDPLIQDTYSIDQVEKAFQTLQNPIKPLIVLLDYGKDLPDDYSCLKPQCYRTENKISYRPISGRRIRVGVIGAGGFAVGTHLPNLKKLNDKYEIKAICNRTGSKAQMVAQQFGARYSTTDYKEILKDPDIDLVMICTRHNLHGQMALEGLQSGKHTFVEKPLCTTKAELEAIKDFFNPKFETQNTKPPLLMVGFNRRFAPQAIKAQERFSKRKTPLMIQYRVNAGYLPPDHWVHDPEEGGGRIIGEVCHFVDFLQFLTEAAPERVYAAKVAKGANVIAEDNVSITIDFADGSTGIILYTALGDKSLPKEYIEIFGGGKAMSINNFKSGRALSLSQDKGHYGEFRAFTEAILNGKPSPISVRELALTTLVIFKIHESLKSGEPVNIDLEEFGLTT